MRAWVWVWVSVSVSELLGGCLVALGAAALTPAGAADGKLLLTGGVSTVDGAAGGGLVPWAVTGSYATAGQWGATAHLGAARTGDDALDARGVAFSWDDRLELSLARQTFDTRNNLAPLNLAGLKLKLDIAGMKLRLAGDAVLDTDWLMPQLALGVMAKRVDAGGLAPTLTGPLGARDQGVEVYLSATKLFLAQSLLVNATVRATQANQGGLLGFGGAHGRHLQVQPELALAWLASRHLALGAEWRRQPDNLYDSVLGAGALKADDWRDLFVAWAPTKTVSITLAWVDLGHVVPALQPRRQTGAYLSAQFAY
jgi:hypothetical protein